MPAQYPNNLDELLGGGIASINATLAQQRDAEAQGQLEQQRMSLANQFAEQANPIKVQQEQANLDTTNAALPGVQALSRQNITKANIDEATQDSTIKAKLSRDLANMSEDQIKKLTNQGQGMVQMADLVDAGQMPSLEQQQQLPPGMLQMLSTPEGRQELRKRGTLIANHTTEHLNALDLEQRRLDVTKSEGAANRKNAWDIANLRFNTMLEIASKKAEKAVSDKDFKAASIHWDNIADQLEQSGDPKATQARERATYYAKLATTAPNNPNAVNVPEAANTGNIAPATPQATGAPSVGAPLAKPAEVQLPGGITVRVKQSHP